MALPRKNSRILKINNIEYTWTVSGNDNIIYLIVCLNENPGQKLIALFNYMNSTESGYVETKIPPSVVKQIIEYALLQGWKPNEKGKELNIGIMNDLIFSQ